MEDTLDLSNKKIKKLTKPSPEEAQVTTLILDDNELQRLDFIDSFTKVQKFSAVRNQLLRMYGVCRLHLLTSLDLSHNGILSIEGLKDLVNLENLSLSGNSIKVIEHLQTNTNLKHLDLSENNISFICDLAFLKNLEELLLHNNRITHLRQCDRFLPPNITILTLANNRIEDLNQISLLAHLTNLNSISFANNPCVVFSGDGRPGFDYRPFVINWCMNVRIIDGYPVDAIESLRAEWLYSQGRGRHFRIGDQQELRQYLATVCPLTAKTLETEENRKLRLILSKAKHHQLQLREQSDLETPIPSPLSRKKLQGTFSSESAGNVSRLGSDRMIASCYVATSLSETSPFMTQSLDPNMLSKNLSSKVSVTSSKNVSNGDIPEKCLDDLSSPLQALSKLVPVPESLMSPDYRPSPIGSACRLNAVGSKSKTQQVVHSPKAGRVTPQKLRKTESKVAITQKKQVDKPLGSKKSGQQSILRKSVNSSEDESEICDSKLQTIQMKVEKSRQRSSGFENGLSESDKAEQAALRIQKVWRGYYVRNKDARVQQIFRSIQSQRADQYIQKLAADMESTKAALESERKIQMLQMQAINALWKKVSTLQTEGGDGPVAIANLSGNSSEVVKDLTQTCSLLQSQIQQLQGSMQDIVKFMTIFSQTTPVLRHLKENGTATQTEISAVHTPQGEGAKVFPFQKMSRPSSLPLPIQRVKREEKNPVLNQELQQFAGSLVDDVIKTVSETKADCLGLETTEITVTDTERMGVKDVENGL